MLFHFKDCGHVPCFQDPALMSEKPTCRVGSHLGLSGNRSVTKYPSTHALYRVSSAFLSMLSYMGTPPDQVNTCFICAASRLFFDLQPRRPIEEDPPLGRRPSHGYISGGICNRWVDWPYLVTSPLLSRMIHLVSAHLQPNSIGLWYMDASGSHR